MMIHRIDNDHVKRCKSDSRALRERGEPRLIARQRMTRTTYEASLKTKLKLALGVASFGLLLALYRPPAAVAQSLPGVSGKSVLSTDTTVPAGTRAVVVGLEVLAPSGLVHGSYLSTAFIYASAASSPTTCTLDLSGGADSSPAITLPAGVTVFIPFEDAGDFNKGVSPAINVNEVGVTAGGGGDVIVHASSGIKIIEMATSRLSSY